MQMLGDWTMNKIMRKCAVWAFILVLNLPSSAFADEQISPGEEQSSHSGTPRNDNIENDGIRFDLPRSFFGKSDDEIFSYVQKQFLGRKDKFEKVVSRIHNHANMPKFAVLTGFGTDGDMYEAIIYDESDNIANPMALNIPYWTEMTHIGKGVHTFMTPLYAERIYGHYYLVYQYMPGQGYEFINNGDSYEITKGTCRHPELPATRICPDKENVFDKYLQRTMQKFCNDPELYKLSRRPETQNSCLPYLKTQLKGVVQ